MIDLWQEIYGTIKRNKLRTFLTGFAVAWGIFMLIVLLGAGNGIIHAFEQNASERALNSIRIFPGWTTKSYDGLKEGRRVQLDNRDMDDTEKQFTENVISAGATVRQCKRQLRTRIYQYLSAGRISQLHRSGNRENSGRTFHQLQRPERPT